MKFDNKDIGARILEIITSGLYDGNLNCLREYVQNSIDAKAALIEISFENSRDVLQIKDDGLGMNEAELERAVKVGISDKTPDDVGWRGIGFWSGVPVSRRIVVLTKKKNGKKLRLEIDNERIRTESDTDKPATDVLTAATGDIEELQISKGEELEQYTMVRLESILRQQKGIFKDEDIRAYLSSTVPVPFDKKAFPLGSKIEELLKTKKVWFREVRVKFQGDEIHRHPTRSDAFIEEIISKDFEINGETVAVGWFLTTKKNRALKHPNSGIVFKKKGFTIGDETLVAKEYEGTFHRWEFGEIHVISPSLRENAARNGFEHNNDILGPFLDKVGEFIGELEKLNRYLSDKTAPGEIQTAKDALDKGDYAKAKDQLKKASKKMTSLRKFPEDSAIKQVKKRVESMSKQDAMQLRRLDARHAKAIAVAKGTSVGGKNCLQNAIDNLHPELKRKMMHPSIKTVRSLVSTNTDGLVQLLQKKTGSNSNELIDLSKEAYDWDRIAPKNNSRGPTLTLMGPFKLGKDAKLENRNRSIGVMTYAIHDLFINTAKHSRGKDCFAWYEKASPDEQDHICAGMLATVDLMYRLISKSQTYKP